MAIRQILRESFIANVNTNALFGLKMQFYASKCNSKKVIQKLIWILVLCDYHMHLAACDKQCNPLQ